MLQKSLPAVPSLRQGTQVLFKWAEWQKKNAPHRHVRSAVSRLAVLRKGELRLVVHQYGDALCGVLQMADVEPKLRVFREWREPLDKVVTKLASRGWEIVSSEVQHEAL